MWSELGFGDFYNQLAVIIILKLIDVNPRYMF